MPTVDVTLALGRDVKVPRYVAAGVPEVWLFSFPDRSVTIHRNGQAEVMVAGDRIVHAETGLTVPVGEIFAHL